MNLYSYVVKQMRRTPSHKATTLIQADGYKDRQESMMHWGYEGDNIRKNADRQPDIYSKPASAI